VSIKLTKKFVPNPNLRGIFDTKVEISGLINTNCGKISAYDMDNKVNSLNIGIMKGELKRSRCL